MRNITQKLREMDSFTDKICGFICFDDFFLSWTLLNFLTPTFLLTPLFFVDYDFLNYLFFKIE